jgi:DNA-binding transcriptional LysR family regulator
MTTAMDSDRDASTSDADLTRLASVNLNLLVPLAALLEERSVTRAAAKVGLSQPAMSHALRRMRRLLGDDLVVRRGSAMTLTPRAVQLLPPLRRVLQQAARIVSSAPFDPAVDRRLITVSMTTSTALVIGSTLARLLAERAPNAVLRLLTSTMTSGTMFTEDGADVALLTGGFTSPYPRERLYDDRWVVITNSGAPAEAGAAELLATLPHIAFDSATYRSRPYDILDAEGVQYTVRHRVSDNLLIPQLISGAGGVAVHRYRVATAMSRYLDLRIEEFPFPVQSVGMDLVWNPWLADDEFKLWLRGLLVEAAATPEPRT